MKRLKQRGSQPVRRTQGIIDELGAIYRWAAVRRDIENLSPEQYELLMRVVATLIDGIDPRAELGIVKRRKSRRYVAGADLWMSRHYWYLKNWKKDKQIVALAQIATEWGVTAANAWKIVRPQKDGAIEYLCAGDGEDFDPPGRDLNIEDTFSILAKKYRERGRKNRH